MSGLQRSSAPSALSSSDDADIGNDKVTNAKAKPVFVINEDEEEVDSKAMKAPKTRGLSKHSTNSIDNGNERHAIRTDRFGRVIIDTNRSKKKINSLGKSILSSRRSSSKQSGKNHSELRQQWTSMITHNGGNNGGSGQGRGSLNINYNKRSKFNINKGKGLRNNERSVSEIDKHGASTFDKCWTKELVAETLQSEPWLSRFYRQISIVAGIVQPLNEKDYQNGLKRYKDKETFHTNFFLDNGDMFLTGFQLNNSENFPFDAHRLFKDAKLSFLLVIVMIVLILFCTIFALVGWWASCYEYITLANSIPHGILLLSGLGDIVLDANQNTNTCLWMHSSAVIIGIYITLPIIGALVLVRLLDNRADLIKSSNIILLSKRSGKPTIMLRAATANGQHLLNFTSKMVVYVFKKEEDTGENYASMTSLDLSHAPSLGYSSMNLLHICDQDSPLTKMGIVSMDEYGVPRLHKEKGLIGFAFYASAKGAAHHFKLFLDMEKSVISPCPNTGRIPMFESTVVTVGFDWRKTKGKSVCVNDMSKISKWKYCSIELRKQNIDNDEAKSDNDETNNLKSGIVDETIIDGDKDSRNDDLGDNEDNREYEIDDLLEFTDDNFSKKEHDADLMTIEED